MPEKEKRQKERRKKNTLETNSEPTSQRTHRKEIEIFFERQT